MGVPGLWQLIKQCEVPVKPESLAGRVIAIDVSLWLHRSAKGIKRTNSHVLMIFLRCCKLLHFGIKPVFVFDGPAPYLKQRILKERQKLKQIKKHEARTAMLKARSKRLQALVVRSLIGTQMTEEKFQRNDDSDKDDVFFNNQFELLSDASSTSSDSSDEQTSIGIGSDSQEDMKFFQKSDLPKEASDFSKFQLKRLLSFSKLNRATNNEIIPAELNREGLQVKSVRRHASDEGCYTVYYERKRTAEDESIGESPIKISRNDTTCSTNPKFEIELNESCHVKQAEEMGHAFISNESPFPERSTYSPPTVLSNTVHSNNQSENSNMEPINISDSKSAPKEFLESLLYQSEARNKTESTVFSTSSDELSDKDFICVPENSLERDNSDSRMSMDSKDISVNADISPKEIKEIIHVQELYSNSSQEESKIVDSEHLFPNKSELKEISSAIGHSNEASILATKLMNESKQLRIDGELAGQEAAPLSDDILNDVKELITMFGIPYVNSPAEAEAQCAFLDCNHLVDGVITDDSDALLFGTQHVYKNFFSSSSPDISLYTLEAIQSQLGLCKQDLIAIAMLTGCDYTSGIRNVGIIHAIKICKSFQGNGIEKLKKFKQWWSSNQTSTSLNKHQRKWLQLRLPENFPAEEIYNAFVSPVVNTSMESFSWAEPQVEMIKSYINKKLGWPLERIEKFVGPTLKRRSRLESET